MPTMIGKVAGVHPGGMTAIVLRKDGGWGGVLHIDPDDPPTEDNDPQVQAVKIARMAKALQPDGGHVIIDRALYGTILDHSDDHHETVKAVLPKVAAGDFIAHADSEKDGLIATVQAKVSVVDARRAAAAAANAAFEKQQFDALIVAYEAETKQTYDPQNPKALSDWLDAKAAAEVEPLAT